MRRSIERRQHVSSHLAEHGLAFELVDAVDGRALSPREIESVYDARAAKRTIGRDHTPAEIACSLSHLALYRRLVQSRMTEVVILEDDVVIRPEFLELLRSRARLPEGWELILCYHSAAQKSVWGGRRLSASLRLVRFASTANGTVGYLLTRTGAEKLLARAYPICAPADHLTGGGLRAGIRLYGIDPPCLGELSSGSAALSTMPETHLRRARPPSPDRLGPVLWPLYCGSVALRNAWRRLSPLSIR